MTNENTLLKRITVNPRICDDILACIAYAHRLVGHERVEPLIMETTA